MADEYSWNLEEIRDRWRKDTGRSQTGDIGDTDVNKQINDYYVNYFPHDARVDEFDIFVTQALSATDDGEYTISIDIDRLDEPVTLNGEPIAFYRDRERFFNDYPEDEQYITEPTLAVGSDTTKVAHSAFDYRLASSGYSYSKAASEVDLTGDTVPQNKYGAWSLKIDEDGTITVEAADGNATGYDTPRLALEALDKAGSDSCFMGYVTVISTGSGGFIPATTELDDDAVTATYTDGKFETRNRPEALLLYGLKMYVRPKPYDIFKIKALSIGDKPAAFADDEAVPADPKWGPAIARGAAILYLSSKGGQARIAELAASTKHIFDSIRSNKIKRLLGTVIQRRY